MKTAGAGRRLVMMAGIIILGIARPVSAQPPNYPDQPVEIIYYYSGNWIAGDCPISFVDKSGKTFDVYSPKNLGAGGFRHPILTWGNGTDGRPEQYSYLIKHFVSWGFVIVASRELKTGSGTTILQGANLLVDANRDPSSVFYRKLDEDEVGVFGHSQGATGAINAMVNSKGLIKTAIAIELPSQAYCDPVEDCRNTNKLTRGSIFFVSGSLDPISPPDQPPLVPGEQSIAAYYKIVPNSVQKVMGILIGPSHNDVQGKPDCTGVSWPCFNGVYGYLGYLTAWMMAELQNNNRAASAFFIRKGEIFQETKNWRDVKSNIWPR